MSSALKYIHGFWSYLACVTQIALTTISSTECSGSRKRINLNEKLRKDDYYWKTLSTRVAQKYNERSPSTETLLVLGVGTARNVVGPLLYSGMELGLCPPLSLHIFLKDFSNDYQVGLNSEKSLFYFQVTSW